MKIHKACAIPRIPFEFYTTTLLPKLKEADGAERKVFCVDTEAIRNGCLFGRDQGLISRPNNREYHINSPGVVALLEKIHQKHLDAEVTLGRDNASYQ